MSQETKPFCELVTSANSPAVPFACNLNSYQQVLIKDRTLIQQKQSKIQCPYCNKQYKQKYILNTHIKSVHKKNPHDCHECGESYPTIQEYKDHLCKALHPELSQKTNLKVQTDSENGELENKKNENVEQCQKLSDQDSTNSNQDNNSIIISSQKQQSFEEKEEEQQQQKKQKINQNKPQQLNDKFLEKLRKINKENSNKFQIQNTNPLQISSTQIDHLNSLLLIQSQAQQAHKNPSSQRLISTEFINNHFISNNNNDDSSSLLQESQNLTQVLKPFNNITNEDESSQTHNILVLDEEKQKIKNQIFSQNQSFSSNSLTSSVQQQYQLLQQQYQFEAAIKNIQQQIQCQQQTRNYEIFQNNLTQQLIQIQQQNLQLAQLLQKQQLEQSQMLQLGGTLNLGGLGVSAPASGVMNTTTTNCLTDLSLYFQLQQQQSIMKQLNQQYLLQQQQWLSTNNNNLVFLRT